MSVTWKVCALFFLVSMTMGAVRRSRFGDNYITNENIEANDLTPPQDPAINTFSKQPAVPLVPTCVFSGYIRDPFNCGKFYHCASSEASPTTYYCKRGLIFNELTEACEDPSWVVC